MRSIVVVGASLAGLRAAETLRREGFDGSLTIVGDEAHYPYDRPPLSKQILTGEWDIDRVELTNDDKLAGLDATWIRGVRAESMSEGAGLGRDIRLADGQVLNADGVIIATGARCRTLPGPQLDGVYTLRTLDDAIAIRAAFDAQPDRVVVIGAGFIGAEVASTARQRGLDVTLVEAAEVPLMRGLGPKMGAVCGDIHRDHGVDLRLGVGVQSINGTERVESITLADGEVVPADVAIVGIGVVPNTEWLDGSGLDVDNGVVCNRWCEAAPGVVAAGDVARWYNERFDEVMRVEHWDNAVEQGTYVAKRLLHGDAHDEPFTPVPWFWSDQYDRKIQLAGRPHADDDVQIVAGSIDERRFAAIYGRSGRLTGILGVNRPRHVMQYRRLIADSASWEEALAFGRE